jgi:LacI family transcriptional regulator
MKKVSLKDVAKHVGVSTALVSYVLNGQAVEKQVNKDTAEKIMGAIEELNYTPNQIAKSLKMRRTNTIGLVVADINYRFSTGITRAIESEAKKRNFTVIYGSSNEDENKFAELIDVFINRRVDGLILIPAENSQQQIKALQKSETPFVLIDRSFPEIRTNYIALDNFKASYKATEYLIKLGHKKIAFINYKTTMFHLLERNRGFAEALSDHKITMVDAWAPQVQSRNLDEEIQKALDSVLNLEEPCEAIFFATDTLTIHGLKYLNKINIRVPDDISVLSFDGSDAFELFYCPITHSKQPLEEMGKLAVSTLLDLVNHSKINMQISLEADIVTGVSCGEQSHDEGD